MPDSLAPAEAAETSPTSSTGEHLEPSPGRSSGWAWVAWVAMGLAVLPLVVAAVRAVRDGWLPMGDNAYFTIRSRDVLTRHHPLVGAWSSGSQAAGQSVNNPGPLGLDVLAPFTKVSAAAGTAVGVAVVNAACVLGIGVVVRRVAGVVAVVWAMAAVSLVTWAMGSELLIEPRQHHALMLPFLAYVVVCWGLAAGWWWSLPWAVLLASLVVQTHLSYAVLVPLVGAWAVVVAVVHLRRRAAAGEVEGRWWEPLRRPGVTAVVVGALCWAQPVADQLWGTRNFGRLRGASDGGDAPGLSAGLRLVASVVGLPSRWGRGGFASYLDRAYLSGGRAVLSLGASLVVVAVVAVLLAVGAVVARRRGDRPALLAVAAAAVALVGAVLTAARVPAGSFGLVSFNYRWLWPVVAFTLLALAMAILGPLGGLLGDGRRGAARPSARTAALVLGPGLALVVLVAANLPKGLVISLTSADLARKPATEEVLRQLGEADVEGPVLFDRTRASFGEPYTYAVLMELQSLGIEFRSRDVGEIWRFGREREDHGEARSILYIATGPTAGDAIPGARRIAYACSLTPAEQDELDRLAQRLLDVLASGDLALSADGRAALDAGELPFLAGARRGEEPTEAGLYLELARLADTGLLAPDAEQRDDLDRWLLLSKRLRDECVGLHLRPIR